MAVLKNEPRDLLLGADNDLVITDDLQWVYGVDAVMQDCRIALQMFAGEWFLDLDVGIPYWQSILGQKPERAIEAARIAFRDELEKVPGVDKVLKISVTVDRATRKLTVKFQVRVTSGETPSDVIGLRIAGGVAA